MGNPLQRQALLLRKSGLSAKAIAAKLGVPHRHALLWLQGLPRVPGERLRDSAEHLRLLSQIAERNGGRLAEGQTYVNSTTPLRFIDADGIEFQKTPDSIRHGRWGSEKLDMLRKAISVAEARGGELLTRSIEKATDTLRWRCSKGHEWEARYSLILRPRGGRKGSWCPRCARNATYAPEEGLLKCREHAERMGGSFLSKTWLGAKGKYSWQCKFGHQWQASFGNIFHKAHPTWCPRCADHALISEMKTRSVFEQLFGAPFPKIKPSWLKSARGGTLELDGLCSELAVAFEYQGEQHYRTSIFCDEQRLLIQQENDELKRRQCAARNILLIEIPYDVDNSHIAWRAFSEAAKHPRLLERIKAIAQSRGHLWAESDPLSLSNGPHTHAIPSNDSSLFADKIEDAKAIAAERGGEFLSSSWLGARSLYRWRCGACSNEWSASYDNVRRGTWCKTCSFRKRGARMRAPADSMISECHHLAKMKGGEFLSDSFSTKHEKYRWRCQHGHEWLSSYFDIKYGRWCPRCARSEVARKMWKTRPRKKMTK